VATLSTFVLRVKTLDCLGLVDGAALRRYPLGGVVVELWYLGLVSVSLVASLVICSFFAYL
jgi:hypothetical protein